MGSYQSSLSFSQPTQVQATDNRLQTCKYRIKLPERNMQPLGTGLEPQALQHPNNSWGLRTQGENERFGPYVPKVLSTLTNKIQNSAQIPRPLQSKATGEGTRFAPFWQFWLRCGLQVRDDIRPGVTGCLLLKGY